MASAAETGPGLVKLISAEGHEFWVDRKCACISGTIKAMLSGTRGEGGCVSSCLHTRGACPVRARAPGQFVESSGEIKFPDIHTAILEKVIQYFYYKVRYTNSNVRIPEFPIEPEIALELLMAANYLECVRRARARFRRCSLRSRVHDLSLSFRRVDEIAAGPRRSPLTSA